MRVDRSPVRDVTRRLMSVRQADVDGMVGTVADVDNYCDTCASTTVHEQPPCADGHEDCPEWACVHCGSAIVRPLMPARRLPRRAAPRRIAA